MTQKYGLVLKVCFAIFSYPSTINSTQKKNVWGGSGVWKGSGISSWSDGSYLWCRYCCRRRSWEFASGKRCRLLRSQAQILICVRIFLELIWVVIVYLLNNNKHSLKRPSPVSLIATRLILRSRQLLCYIQALQGCAQGEINRSFISRTQFQSRRPRHRQWGVRLTSCS